MRRYSISFVLIVLILSMLIGAVAGSLLSQVFGLEFLDWHILPSSFKIVRDFYIIKNIELQLTPASLLGLVIAVWFLIKR